MKLESRAERRHRRREQRKAQEVRVRQKGFGLTDIFGETDANPDPDAVSDALKFFAVAGFGLIGLLVIGVLVSPIVYSDAWLMDVAENKPDWMFKEYAISPQMTSYTAGFQLEKNRNYWCEWVDECTDDACYGLAWKLNGFPQSCEQRLKLQRGRTD